MLFVKTSENLNKTRIELIFEETVAICDHLDVILQYSTEPVLLSYVQ